MLLRGTWEEITRIAGRRERKEDSGGTSEVYPNEAGKEFKVRCESFFRRTCRQRPPSFPGLGPSSACHTRDCRNKPARSWRNSATGRNKVRYRSPADRFV